MIQHSQVFVYLAKILGNNNLVLLLHVAVLVTYSMILRVQIHPINSGACRTYYYTNTNLALGKDGLIHFDTNVVSILRTVGSSNPAFES